MGLRLDLSARTLTFTKNGSPHGPGHTNVVGPVLPCVEMYGQGEVMTLSPRMNTSSLASSSDVEQQQQQQQQQERLRSMLSWAAGRATSAGFIRGRTR